MSAVVQLCGINAEVVRECSRLGVYRYRALLNKQYAENTKKIDDLLKILEKDEDNMCPVLLQCLTTSHAAYEERLKDAIAVKKGLDTRLLLLSGLV